MIMQALGLHNVIEDSRVSTLRSRCMRNTTKLSVNEHTRKEKKKDGQIIDSSRKRLSRKAENDTLERLPRTGAST